MAKYVSRHAKGKETSYSPKPIKEEEKTKIYEEIDDEEDEPYQYEEDEEEYEEYEGKKGKKSVFTTILIILLVVLILAGACYAVWRFVLNKPEEKPIETTVEQTTMAPTEPSTEAPTESEEEKIEKAAKAYVAKMTEDERIYQMFIVRPESLTGVDVATQAGDQTKEALAKYPVGGIALFADNLETKEQTTEMIKNLQSYTKTPYTFQ